MTFSNPKFLAAIAVLACLVAIPLPTQAQTTLPSTTLAAAIGGPSTGATGAARFPQYIQLASVTGITAPGQPTSTSEIGTPTGSSFTILYVDREAMQVLSVNSTTNVVFVNRGFLGTTANAHLNGATVYYGPPNYFSNSGYWNNSGPSGACTSSIQPVLPVLVTDTGRQYNCVAGQWSEVTTDGYFFVSPANCGSAVATTAYASGSPIVTTAAAGNQVYSVTTNTTAGTIEVTCPINVPSRLTTGKGVTLTAASLLYGVQTTALSSIAAATVKSVTYPASTAGGAAAAGTVANAAGSLTKTPTSLQFTTTTSGQCFNEKITFGTPIQATTDLTNYALDQVFTTAGTTATTLQVCGVIVYYNLNQ